MKRKMIISTGLVLFLAALAFALPRSADPVRMTVHEWGTFTSVAGEDGQPVVWRSAGTPNDLPCFVEKFSGFKNGLSGTVRMETPVLYFYGSRDSSAQVKVQFRNGTITEWYPKATLSRSFDAIEWSDVKVTPGAKGVFPGAGQSHYYAARETDAAPLRVGSQGEKFLFYRGVGTFPLPVSAKAMTDGSVQARSVGADAVSGVIFFENRAGKLRYQVAGTLDGERTFDAGLAGSDLHMLFTTLEDILVGQGLFRKEAQAMIETWRDSWFEEGTRVFYIVPRPAIDAALPLEIEPAPAEVARVFVGRMEIITPAIQEDVKQAIAGNDRAALEKYGRFLEPIAARIGARNALLDSVYSSRFSPPVGCD